MAPFGHHLLAAWPLEPGLTYLNHGTVGVTPLAVLEAQRTIRDEIERNPSRLPLARAVRDHRWAPRPARPRLRQAADVVGAFVGALATTWSSSTTRPLVRTRSCARAARAGDEIVVTDLGYGGVTNAATFAARERGAIVRAVAMPVPGAIGRMRS